jgi:hypothetical protein
MAHAGSRLKPTDCLERHRLESQPSSRTGENPPYGMIGRIEETSASYEARSAPRSYPTALHVAVRGIIEDENLGHFWASLSAAQPKLVQRSEGCVVRTTVRFVRLGTDRSPIELTRSVRARFAGNPTLPQGPRMTGRLPPSSTERNCSSSGSLKHAFEPSLFEPKSPLPGNGIFKPETNGPKRRRSSRRGDRETKPTRRTPPIRG